MTINAKTLRQYREIKGFSQSGLAENSGVSKKTISRIELGEIDRPNKATKDKLAKALGVEVADLAKSSDERDEVERELRKAGYRKLNVFVDSETTRAYAMVQHRYGVSEQTLIDMAPLFVALLAEGSLRWRKEKADALKNAVDEVYSAARDAPHLAYANSVKYAEEGLYDEYRSIENTDVFGRELSEEADNFGFEPSENNPFADYLRWLCKDIEVTAVEIDPERPVRWKEDDGMPEFRIAQEKFNEIASSDVWAEFAIDRGYARLSDIPAEFMDEKKQKERVEWIASKIPDEARKEHQKLLDVLESLHQL
ncbi:MAG: helix-turn-helix domain-containing protein [Thiotrichales bacterium]